MGKEFSSALIINNSDVGVYYGIVKNKEVLESKKIAFTGKIGTGQQDIITKPALNAQGTYQVTYVKNKQPDCNIFVPPKGDSRLGLKTRDKIPVKSVLQIAIGERVQYLTLHKGFEAFVVTPAYGLAILSHKQLINYCDKKMKETHSIDNTIKQPLLQIMDEIIDQQELKTLEGDDNYQLVDKILQLKARLGIK